MAMKRFNGNGDPQEFAGNNCFHLRTIDDNHNTISLTGVLKEMPSFGLSTEWMEAPRAAFGKKIQEFFMSDLINTAGFLSGAVNYSQLLTDDWSSRMYNGTTNKDITLNFRIYPQNTLGQSAPERWLEYLSKYATTSSDSVMSFDGLTKNIDNALNALKEKGEEYGEMASATRNLFAGTEGDAESDKNKEKRKKNLAEIINRMPDYLNRAESKIRQSVLASAGEATIEDWKGDKDKKKLVNRKISDIIGAIKIELKNRDKNATASDIDLTEAEQFNFVFSWLTRKGTSKSSEVADCETLDTTKCILNVDEIVNAIQDQDSDFENELVAGETKEQPIVTNFIKSVLKEINRLIISDKLDFDANYETIKNNFSTIKKIEDTLASEYKDEDRWSNVDFLAARLWQLDIYRFIFKKPIIVAITDWKVTPSLEMMGNKHAYYDFSITCKPDQVKSLNRWKQVVKYEPQPEVN